MEYHLRGLVARIAGGALVLAAAAPADAYLFWSQPKLQGQPVNGDEPGIAAPMIGAKPDEVKANLLWAMRAGLNVAALQCQFAPSLRTVSNYNALLNQHKAELQKAYGTISAYFKRTGGKPGRPSSINIPRAPTTASPRCTRSLLSAKPQRRSAMRLRARHSASSPPSRSTGCANSATA